MSPAGRAAPLHDGIATRLAGTPLLVLLDIDGTIAPIAPRPEDAEVPAGTQRAIAALASCEGVHVALVTGRAAADGRRMAGAARTWVIGNHGAETVSPDGRHSVHPELEPFRAPIARAAGELGDLTARMDGVIVENKVWSLSVHYRLADPSRVPELRSAVHDIARRLALAVTDGKKVVEVRAPVDVNKGTAVQALAERLGAMAASASVLMIGDDVTDEDAFRVLRDHAPNAVTVRVTEDPETSTAAEFAVRDTAAVRETLERLLRQRR